MAVRMFVLTVSTYLICLPHLGRAADYSVVELAQWNRNLEAENWRAFMGGQTQSTLGAFLVKPLSTDAREAPSNLKVCGITFESRERRRFTSPPVPSEIKIGTAASLEISGSLRQVTTQLEEGVSVRIKIRNPRWVAFEPNKVTSIVYASAIWAAPNLRAKIIECISKNKSMPVVESIIRANIIVSFHQNNGHIINADDIIKNIDKENILYGSTYGKGHYYVIKDATLARRSAICVNESIFFKNINGNVGAELCN